MRGLLIAALWLLIAGVASADYTIKITIPTGPGLTRLAQLCDWLRADPELRKPDMTNDECGERFFKQGAFLYAREKKLQELRAAGNVALTAEEAQFWVDLPLPPPGPTAAPTPTSTSTPTPTATPTAEPTP